MGRPEISVIIAVHNGEAFLETCVASLSRQTFSDFEIVVCDDASTDSTPTLLQDLSRREPRLRIITNDRNRGLATSLNSALDVAKGNLVARLDADDVAYEDRLARQQAAFAGNPRLVLLGSNVVYCNTEGREIDRSDFPIEDRTIRAMSMLQNPFAHPSVMLRREALERHGLRYDPAFETTQDWDFWVRVMQYGMVANLPEILVRQLVHEGSISRRRRYVQLANSVRIQREQARRLLGAPLCDDAGYGLLNGGLFDGRAEADAAGFDRVAASELALDAYQHLSASGKNLSTPAFRRWIVERCLRVGVLPLWRPRCWLLLLRLVREHFVAILPAVAHAYRRRRGLR